MRAASHVLIDISAPASRLSLNRILCSSLVPLSLSFKTSADVIGVVTIMSGLDVAGVVLGALPLVISALEHYAESVNTAKRYWRYETELRTLILQVNTEKGIFVNTLEQLLTGIVRIEQVNDFVASAGGQI